jgi:DNA-binding NtrC family response regulator
LSLLGVPEELQLGELFGWRKGAFTGAIRDNPGSVARAQGGTLFIDEIDKLSLRAQAGLLQFLDSHTFRSLGEGGRERAADVRIIVGTNVDLRASVREGRFRQDLYYRVNVLPVRVPPLSERVDEIVGWAGYMLRRRHLESDARCGVRLAEAAAARLRASSWPGNLRQLDNILRRAYALAAGALVEEVREELVIDRGHIEAALDGDEEEEESLVTLLRRAASAFVRECERRRGDGEGRLDLDQADVFRGFVVGRAIQVAGGREQAMEWLGKGHLLANRNHHRLLRREWEKLRAFCQALGIDEGVIQAELWPAEEAERGQAVGAAEAPEGG